MFCRRRGVDWHCLYLAVPNRAVGDADGRCDLSDIPIGVWG